VFDPPNVVAPDEKVVPLETVNVALVGTLKLPVRVTPFRRPPELLNVSALFEPFTVPPTTVPP
jgi:hypothetical protein